MSKYQESPAYRVQLYAKYGEVFQSAPEEFDAKAAKRWGRAYDYYLRGWLPQSKNAHIVDLGCGYGLLLHFFRERGYDHIAAVDISPDQARRARQVVQNVYEENVLEFLQRHTAEFDFITAFDLIEHLTKDEVLRFIRGCFHALKPGGRLVLQTTNADSPFGMASRYGDLTHEVCFNPNLLGRLLFRIGFREVCARELGPVPLGYSALSSSRWFIWRIVRAALQLWNLAETGAALPIFSRVFLITARKC